MIIHCPKCNFEQPKVEYCAKCGVEISKYKKKPLPLKDRISKNSSVYIVLILSVMIGLTIHLKNNWLSSNEEIYSFQPANDKQAREVASNTQQTLKLENSHSLTEKNSEIVDNKQADENPYVEIYVIEMPTNFLAFFANKALNKPSLSKLNHTSISDANRSYLDKIPSSHILYQTTYYVNSFQDPFTLQQTVFDPNLDDDLGFYLNIGIDSFREKNLILNLSLRRNFYTNGNTGSNERLSEKVELKVNETKVIFGILPHKELTEQESNLFQTGYLNLLNTPSYQSLESTFVIILTYKY